MLFKPDRIGNPGFQDVQFENSSYGIHKKKRKFQNVSAFFHSLDRDL
jgi:hypothetical protein